MNFSLLRQLPACNFLPQNLFLRSSLSVLLESKEVMSVSSCKYLQAIIGPHCGSLSHALGGFAFELKGKINIIASFWMKECRAIAFGVLGWDVFRTGYVVCHCVKRENCQQTVALVSKMLLLCALLIYLTPGVWFCISYLSKSYLSWGIMLIMLKNIDMYFFSCYNERTA